jgi:hypothetical protein
MRRIMLVVVVALVMGAMMVVMAIPAFGAANPHASCQGAAHSNQSEQGAAGDFHQQLAHEGRNGQAAKFYATAGPQGQDRNTSAILTPDPANTVCSQS